MKRFFCDLCSNEMSYTTPAIVNTNETLRTVLLTGAHKHQLRIALRIKIEAKRLEQPIDTRPGWKRGRDDNPLAPILHHADLCEACRWGLLEHLRAGHSRSADTLLADPERPLDWNGLPPTKVGEPSDGFPYD